MCVCVSVYMYVRYHKRCAKFRGHAYHAGEMTTLSRATDYEYSIILGGRVGAGKTTLFHRILYDSIPEEPRSPIGHYENGLERGVYCMSVDGDTVKVRDIWCVCVCVM